MSTRSFIGHQNQDGTITYVYCHYDGYLGGVGRDLLGYSTSESVMEMISHGDRSTVEGPYYKDRGDDNTDPVTVMSEQEFILDARGIDYVYLFKDSRWYVCCMYNDQKEFVQY